MENIACTSCSAINSSNDEHCTKCGEPLAAAKLQHSIDGLRKATERLHELTQPTPSFSSFNGFGTALLDYRARPDGTYEAIRWVTAMFLPIVPLSAYVVQPTGQEFGYGRATSSFRIIDKIPLSAARIFRTYLLAVVGLLPIVIGFIYSSTVNRTLGGSLAFLAMLVAIGWAIYCIFFKLKNDSKAYKMKTASEE